MNLADTRLGDAEDLADLGEGHVLHVQQDRDFAFALGKAGERLAELGLGFRDRRGLQWIEALIEACRGDGIGGLLALPVADTLKRAEGDRAVATLARADVWQAQTPQMFRLGVLTDALKRTKDATDEASAIEAIGLRPKLVAGSAENIKVTHPGDFPIAEALLARRAGA